MKELIPLAKALVLRVFVALQAYDAREPVRFRAQLAAVIMTVGALVPCLVTQDLANTVSGVVMVALPLMVAESARKRVSPVK